MGICRQRLKRLLALWRIGGFPITRFEKATLDIASEHPFGGPNAGIPEVEIMEEVTQLVREARKSNNNLAFRRNEISSGDRRSLDPTRA